MINLDQFMADREAGTDGPWGRDAGHNPVILRGVSFLAFANYETEEGEANARRIARLPDLEAAFLEAMAIISAMDEFKGGWIAPNDQ